MPDPPLIYVFGSFRLDPARLTVSRDGVVVPTTPRIFSTLLYLVENAGRTLSKDEMLQALWPGRIAEEANLSQAVSSVRKLLANGDAGDNLIITVPGRGYRFTGQVETLSAALEPAQVLPQPTPPPPVLEAATPGASAKARRSRRWPWVLAGVGALTAVTGMIWWSAAPSARLPTGRTGVVLADLQNYTGDADFNHVVSRVLQVDLDQSPFLQVATDSKVADTLALMEQPKGAPVTPALARAVCARAANGGAVIAPAIASLQRRYIVTLSASDCVNGRSLFDGKAEAPDKEAIPHAIDVLAEQMRRRIGEVQSSIEKFDVPLAPERTSSFAALRAYSEAEWLTRQGKALDAIPFYQHAVELDPDFAMAYLGMSSAYYGMHRRTEDAAAITNAYERRNLVSERNALLITNHYNVTVTRNLDAARRSLELLTTLYPRDATAWLYLSDVCFRLGDFDAAVSAGERALELDPKRSGAYTVLARALNRANHTARAEQIDQTALKEGPESGPLRQQRIAWRFLQGDEAGGRKLVQATAGGPLEREALLELYNFAFVEGRMHETQDLQARIETLSRPNGFHPDFTMQAGNHADIGLTAQALADLRRVPPELWTGEDDYYAALLADPAEAKAWLKRDLARWPDDTLLKGQYAPEARAALLLREGRPLQAVQVLDGTGRFKFRDLDAPYLRATALLAAKDARGAAAGFREVLAQTGTAYDSQFVMARLGLARSLRLEGDLAGSRKAYEAFLAAWSHADPDLPPLKAAKLEYAALPH
jgi:DNA-binding winged helix-turn-helix (wHTH) protein/tetratricopeptide (TPR) repeat protein